MGLYAIGTRRVREDREGRMVGCQGREGEGEGGREGEEGIRECMQAGKGIEMKGWGCMDGVIKGARVGR